MRIARFHQSGVERWGFVEDARGFLVAPSGPSLLEALALDGAQLIDLRAACTESASLDQLQLLAPIARPPQFLGVGLNYVDHAEESGMDPPAHPMTFGFLSSAIIGPDATIELPSSSDEVDWEVELAVVIGKPGKRIPAERAIEHVAGYTIVNDLSARDIQFGDIQMTRGKSLDTLKPMGPWIATADELGAAEHLDLELRVNDIVKQSGNTSNLIFDVRHLIAFLSEEITLETGSVISTGTPAGVGFSRQPPEFLRAGDVVRLEIGGIGVLTNPIVGPA